MASRMVAVMAHPMRASSCCCPRRVICRWDVLTEGAKVEDPTKECPAERKISNEDGRRRLAQIPINPRGVIRESKRVVLVQDSSEDLEKLAWNRRSSSKGTYDKDA